MCPLPSCKRYSSTAIPGGLDHEPSSPITAFMAPLASLSHPPIPAPIPLASGVMYYPPPTNPTPPTTHSSRVLPADSPVLVPEMGSALLDTAVDKVMFLVMRELGLGQFSKRLSVAGMSDAAAAVVLAGMGHTHVEDGGSSRESSVTVAGKREKTPDRHTHFDTTTLPYIPPITDSGSSSHITPSRPKPTPTQTEHSQPSTSSTESSDTPISDESIHTVSSGISRKISKRRKNTLGEPSRPELSFERELMGILECDVCALLLYEPITTPCQHVSPRPRGTADH